MIATVNGKATDLKSFHDGHTSIPVFPRGIEGSFKDGKWIGKSKT